MSQFGLVKTIRLFRTMPKQYEFSTIQGMSTDITLQTPANTSDTHKHHSFTPISHTPPHPSPTSDITRHIQTTKEANTYQQTPADVNRHFQASAILKQHLGGSGDVRECLLVQLVSVDFNLCINSAWGMFWGVLDCIWTVSLDVYGVRVCIEHNPQCIYVIQ